MKLSKRLKYIAGLVNYRTLADIGCDHCLLPVYLAKEGRLDRAYATDKNAGPLSKARELVKSCGLEHVVDLRLGSGLFPVAGEGAMACVIAGMGGMTIIDILNENLDTAKSFKQLILSPERDLPAVRRFLHTNGFMISDEHIIIDGNIFYFIVEAVLGEERYEEDEYVFGRALPLKASPVFRQFIMEELNKTQRIYDNLPESIKIVSDELAKYKAICEKTLLNL